ncbi:MAG: exopolysaccharide biosynthesis polyprenyl glycosylphosphotransferase [Allomuricauda sp.]|jgi:exopolysaccharide biosynthesis polyprenyl glycosylphosphotransferase|uniref:exopolysaccharide biosynthesis polyprenyl glycosylphosphotransferase n=1 Tax=Allomuricauda sp. ARW1Y1 TaxID=2663843 RepID=UPI0015CB8011|nr:exopolysaccharide biosynthesis polyprenyl glycosylphosphotransferase [Muricauda sp. ARW1Y1]NYJ28053.1 exopolysaccharide biosynthesis polyprenyl glycosylphosphotransferase [Muricauda sp. ARW1Y1]
MSTKPLLNTLERKSILFLGDLTLIGLSLRNFVLRAVDYQNEDPLFYQIAIVGIGVVIYFLLAYIFETYNLEKVPKSVTYSIIRIFTITFLFTVSIVFVTTFFFAFAYWQLYLLVFMIFCPIQLSLWRLLFNYIFKFVPTVKRVLYIYDASTEDSLQKNVNNINGEEGNETYYKVVSTYLNSDNSDPISENKLLENNIDSLIINTRSYNHFSKQMENMLVNSLLSGKEVLTYTSFYESTYEALPIDSHNDSLYEVLQLSNNKIHYIQGIANFTFNFFLTFVSGLAFLLSIPFVFLLNIFLNPGPLFYTQLRVGKHGKEYKVFKFRSMVVDAEKKGAKMATKNDARVTKFGKVLRKFRVDELPQVWSIIRGDMSFIGPRPERKVFVDKLNEVTPFYNVRHLVKPGISGWAQVKYKYGENLEDSIRKLEYDLYYIKNKSIVLDLRIIFKTLSTILFSRGI